MAQGAAAPGLGDDRVMDGHLPRSKVLAKIIRALKQHPPEN
jgi:hypothetical protein